jgi:hypothetical protein
MSSLHDILGHEFVTAINNTKICGICNEELPIANFGKDSGANYLRYECRACARKMAKTVADIKKTAPLIAANHVCPVCKKNEATLRKRNKNRKSVWCADHDHTTHRFRGWVCFRCNPGMGHFDDDPDLCDNAATYLRASKLATIDLSSDLFT